MVRGLVPSMSYVSAGHSESRKYVRANATLQESGGTWSVTKNFSLGLKLSLSDEMPFSGRMEAPSQLPGILSLELRAILM